MEEIKVWTSGYCHHLNCCGWAYLIRYETEEGVFNISDVGYDKGSTTHQMSLKAIWQALKKINDLPDRMTDVVILFSNDKRSVNCINGVYECDTKVVGDYLDEIDWARGQLKIEFFLASDYFYIKENNIVNKMAMNIK